MIARAAIACLLGWLAGPGAWAQPALSLEIVPPPGPAPASLARGGLPLPPGTGITTWQDVVVTDRRGQVLPAGVQVTAWREGRDGRPGEARWITLAVPWQTGLAGPLLVRLRSAEDPPPAPLLSVAHPPAVVTPGLAVRFGDGQPVLIQDMRLEERLFPIGATLVLTDRSGRRQVFSPGPPEVELVDAAEVRVRWRGPLGKDGLVATVRATAARGSAVLGLQVRLENPGPLDLFEPGKPGAVHLAGLALELAPGPGWTAGWDGVAGSPLPVVVDLASRGPVAGDFLNGLVWSSRSGETRRQGIRHGGVVALERPDGGLLVGRRHAAEEAPARFELRADRSVVELLPLGGHGPVVRGRHGRPGKGPDPDPLDERLHRFEGGLWKTFDLALEPLPRRVAPGDLAGLQRLLETPPLLVADPAVVAGFDPGFLISPFASNGDPGRERFQRIVRMLVDDRAADTLPGIGQVGLPGLMRRGGRSQDRNPYGWSDFGDVPWSEGWSSNHYDLPFAMLAGFLATADRVFLDRGSIHARHQRDIDTVHSAPADRYSGAQRYEKGFWHGNYMTPQQSHQWLTGLFLLHVLTGDPGAREALDEAGRYLLALDLDDWSGLYGARMVGWPVDNLITMWILSGEARYREKAARALAAFERREQEWGGKGYALNRAFATKKHARPVMQGWHHAILMSAAARYALQVGDDRFDPLLARMAGHLVAELLLPPADGAPWRTWEFWAPDGYRYHASSHHLWMVSNALAQTAFVLGDRKLLGRAQELYESVARFDQWTSGSAPGSASDPSTWSAITALPKSYPGTESKVLSHAGRFGWGVPAVVDRMPPEDR